MPRPSVHLETRPFHTNDIKVAILTDRIVDLAGNNLCRLGPPSTGFQQSFAIITSAEMNLTIPTSQPRQCWLGGRCSKRTFQRKTARPHLPSSFARYSSILRLSGRHRVLLIVSRFVGCWRFRIHHYLDPASSLRPSRRGRSGDAGTWPKNTISPEMVMGFLT